MKKLFLFAAVGFLFAAGAAKAEETKPGVGVNTAQSCEDIVNARLKKDASAAGTEEAEVDANGKPVKDAK